ncbi:MAG: M20 family metallopeptidase [Armatimonadetes bacterium]|nr:M20 family metallopeptidase [Armatimonadota bacterium]
MTSVSRERVYAIVDGVFTELWTVADFIWHHPEIAHTEHQSMRVLAETLERHGFVVQRGVAGFPTAFRADIHVKEGAPTVAFLAEYDALPEIGHACGHNLIGTAAVGAGVALARLAKEAGGNVCVIGCPAEEVPPPVKVAMHERGAFSGVDLAMYLHGSDRTTAGGRSLALDTLDMRFRGKASHAAAGPERGRSALDAAVLCMHAIELLREHVPSDMRIHGIITNGGQAPNVVPEFAALRYLVRGPTRAVVDAVVPRVIRCAQAAALATDTEVEIENVGKYWDKLNVPALNAALLEEAAAAGALDVREPPEGAASNDVGAVTYAVPTATLNVKLVPDGVSAHSVEFRDAAGGEPGQKALRFGAKAMAATGWRFLADEAFRERVRGEHRAAVARARS